MAFIPAEFATSTHTHQSSQNYHKVLDCLCRYARQYVHVHIFCCYCWKLFIILCPSYKQKLTAWMHFNSTMILTLQGALHQYRITFCRECPSSCNNIRIESFLSKWFHLIRVILDWIYSQTDHGAKIV